jgi:hypothetical protein
MSADKSGSEGAKACSLGRKPQGIESPRAPRALKGRRRSSASTALCPILDKRGPVAPSRGAVRPPALERRNPAGASAPSRIFVAPPRGLGRPSRGPNAPSRILVAPWRGPIGPPPGRDRSASLRPKALPTTKLPSTAPPSPLRGSRGFFMDPPSWGLRPRLHASAPSGQKRFCRIRLGNP